MRSIVGRLSSPIVTTVAPTMPVEAARNAPTTTTETARPPGSGPKTRAMVVRRSSAMRERSSVMPIITNISTASSVSIDCPAKTRSFIRLTMKPRLRSIASSQPPGNRSSVERGRSGKLNFDISASTMPCASSAAYSADPRSTNSCPSRSAPSSEARIAKAMMPAPPSAKATGKPETIPAKRQRNTMIRPISTPSSPGNICAAP